MRRVLQRGAAICAGLALVAPAALGQVLIGGGAGMVYGPLVPVVPWPGMLYAPAPYVLVDPWLVTPFAPRSPDLWPSCYRYGRCSAAEIAAYRYRLERLERLAPSAPPDALRPDLLWPRSSIVPPTPEENIRPEFRGASVPREEYLESGRPIGARAGDPVKPQ
jgi:hypothetical protein